MDGATAVQARPFEAADRNYGWGHNPPMSDDPNEIANTLIRENGLDRALEIALEGTAAANERGDNYELSVWREVKRVLRDRITG